MFSIDPLLDRFMFNIDPLFDRFMFSIDPLNTIDSLLTLNYANNIYIHIIHVYINCPYIFAKTFVTCTFAIQFAIYLSCCN